jgi:cellobiose-specific phosphotransferase system component IIC
MTVESASFKMLAIGVLAIASTVLISSILEFIGSKKTITSIYQIIYKFLLYLTKLSPFWGTYTVELPVI